MTETQQRFLRAIAERVPMGQVVELHLFPPIRQGGVETGVAVVAEDPRPHVAAVDDGVAADSPTLVEESVTVIADDTEVRDAVEDDDSPYAVSASNGTSLDADFDSDDFDDDEDRDADDDEESDDDLDDDDRDHDDDVDADDEDDDDVLTGADESAARVASRLTIHTARYRLTLKGVDRGKWEVDVVAEADAPLAALDAVVRGVQRRAGEGAEPDRLSAEAWRDALDAPLASLER